MAIYRHFKGGIYELLGTAKDSDNQDELVIYQSIAPNKQLWIRKKSDFFGYKTINGIRIKRFTKINNIMNTHIFVSKEIRDLLESNGYDLEDIVKGTNTDASTLNTLYPQTDNGIQSKEIALIILATGTAIVGVLYALNKILKNINNKPVVIEYDELEPIYEDGKILKDTNGMPFLKNTRKIKVVEFEHKGEKIDLSAKIESNAIEISIKHED